MNLYSASSKQNESLVFWTPTRTEPAQSYPEMIDKYGSLNEADRTRLEHAARELMTREEVERLANDLQNMADIQLQVCDIELPISDTPEVTCGIEDYARSIHGRELDLPQFGFRGWLPPEGGSWEKS
jgi:hypothetical protein